MSSPNEVMDGCEIVDSSPCSPLHYDGVTEQVWACVKKIIAKNYGVIITDDSGSFSKDGFTFQWKYSSSAQTIGIQCKDSPWYVPCFAINNTIEAIAKQARLPDCGIH